MFIFYFLIFTSSIRTTLNTNLGSVRSWDKRILTQLTISYLDFYLETSVFSFHLKKLINFEIKTLILGGKVV